MKTKNENKDDNNKGDSYRETLFLNSRYTVKTHLIMIYSFLQDTPQAY